MQILCSSRCRLVVGGLIFRGTCCFTFYNYVLLLTTHFNLKGQQLFLDNFIKGCRGDPGSAMWGSTPCQTQPECFEERSCSLPRGICPERTSLSTLLFKGPIKAEYKSDCGFTIRSWITNSGIMGPSYAAVPCAANNPAYEGYSTLYVAAVFRCLMFNLHTARVPYA